MESTRPGGEIYGETEGKGLRPKGLRLKAEGGKVVDEAEGG